MKMFLKYVSFFFFVLNFLKVYSQDMFYPDNLVIGNLRRREVIPLHSINNNYNHNYRRRFGGVDPQPNLNYRRTKDIRDEFIDRRFELTESQIREAKMAENKENNLDKLHSELRWLTIDTDEGIGIGI